MTEDGFQEPRVAVSIARKINLGDYESVDIFMAVSGIEAGATDEEIEELLVTGERAFSLLKNRMSKKIKDIKAARKEN